MELVNATQLPAAYTIGLDPDGRERIVVVVKGTYDIPAAGGVAAPAAEQQPLIFADTFDGEPGLSAVEYESEFAPFKPYCDVLLRGSAYAPKGRPVERVPVALQVGQLSKHFEVVGKRYWTAGVAGGVTASSPEPFATMPISYGSAYGGGMPDADQPELVDAYAANPVGVGYAPKASQTDLFGKPLPNTQDPRQPIDSPKGQYRPMGFGPIGRNFAERIGHAGTYDAAWLEEHYPFLPPDFDNRYFQAAPSDQQIPHSPGGQTVNLLNLTPEPLAPFQLPSMDLPVEFTNAKIERTEQTAALDTILIEPDLMRVQMLWRASLPLKRNIKELRQVVIGRMPKGWYRARLLGKTYYPSLRHLAEANRQA